MLPTRERLKTIVTLSAPIVGGMIAQNLMSLIDTAMVGRLGDAALAGVGIGNFLFLLIISAMLGMSAGVQALVGRRIGEKRPDLAGLDLNSGILISTAAGLLLAIIGYLLVPWLYSLVTRDPQVIDAGIAYLLPRIPSMLLIGLNISFRAYWNGISSPKWSLLSLVVTMVVNISFNYMLIFGKFGFPRLETMGAGLATTIAVFAGAVTSVVLGLIYARQNGFLAGLPDPARIKTLISVALPESMRNFLLFLGLVVFFTIVGLLGTTELAAFNVVLNIMLVALLPAMGIGTAALTLVSQALGGKNLAEAKRWGWEVALVGSGVLLLFAAVVVPAPEFVVGLFVPDPDTIRIAAPPLRVIGMFMWIEAIGLILSLSLIGAGATRLVMLIATGFQWGLSLPLNWFIGVHLGYGLLGMFLSGFVIVILRTALYAWIWQRGRWAVLKI